MTDYLEERAAEPCGRTVPRSVLAALSFMEEKGDVTRENRVSTTPMVRSTVSAIELALQGDALPTRKAPAFTIMLIVALEFLVEDEARAFALRSYAWVLLVRVWAASVAGHDQCLRRGAGGIVGQEQD